MNQQSNLLLKQPKQPSKTGLKPEYSKKTFASIIAIAASAGGMTLIGLLYVLPPMLVQVRYSKVHPTAVPWYGDQALCEDTGRVWDKGECWDQEHSPIF